LLTHEPCSPPCWYGITPDASTVDELNSFLLAHHEFVSRCQSYDNTASGGYAGILCDRAEFAFRDGVVDSISVEVIPPIELGDVIAQYGAPEAVSLYLVRGTTSNLQQNQTSDLYYPQWGFIASSTQTQSPPFTFALAQKTLIDRVFYDREDDLRRMPGMPHVPWHGYGVYPCEGVDCP
jgi:hypothetical protein